MNEIYTIMDALKPLNPAQYPEVLLRRLVVLAAVQHNLALNRPRVFTAHTLKGEVEKFQDLKVWAQNMLGFVTSLPVKCAG